MNITALGPWVITVSILGLIPVGDSATVAAKSSAKAESSGSQAGRSHEASKPAKPKSSNPADPQAGLGPAAPSQQNPTPSQQTQIVEERLRRGELDEPGPQGRISDRLDQFYQGSEDLPGRQAAGTPDR
jgi:hypothetical protein